MIFKEEIVEMKGKIIGTALITALMITGIVIAQASPVTTNDGVIEAKVAKQLRMLPYYGVFDHIAFDVNGSTVTLYGQVYNAINKPDAEAYVKKIKGVSEVVNEIQVLPPSSYDDVIRRRAVRAFVRGPAIYRYLQGTNPSMRIIVDNGRITLEGVVNNKRDRDYAGILANGIPGVFKVTNNLMVEGAR